MLSRGKSPFNMDLKKLHIMVFCDKRLREIRIMKLRKKKIYIVRIGDKRLDTPKIT